MTQKKSFIERFPLNLTLKRWFTAFPFIVRGRPHLHVNLQLFSSILSKKEKEKENIKENTKGRSFWAGRRSYSNGDKG